eukprot:3435889-Rhodomonas_salina.4
MSVLRLEGPRPVSLCRVVSRGESDSDLPCWGSGRADVACNSTSEDFAAELKSLGQPRSQPECGRDGVTSASLPVGVPVSVLRHADGAC